MLSAGQLTVTSPPSTTSSTSPQPPPPPSGGALPSATVPWPTTSTSTATAGLMINGGTLEPGQAADYLNGQTDLAKWGLGANTLASVCNAITSWVGLAQQGEAMSSYYNYMNKVADNGMTVALEQLQVQEKGMDYAKILAEEQQDHEVKLSRLNQALQVKLARVLEQGKTDRAGIYAANNAFSNYDYGRPSIS